MTVDIKRTYYGWTDTTPLAAGATISVEGQGLVATLQDGIEVVAPAVFAVAGTFAGFARFRQLQFGVAAKVEDLVVPHSAPLTVELAKQQILELRCWSPVDGIAFAKVVAPAVPGPGVVSVDAAHGILTFNVADIDKHMVITYRWAMTVMEAKTTFYEAPYNYPDPNLFGQVGVGKGKSRLYTMHYDATKLYDAASVLTLGDAGIITIGGSTAIPHARVIQVPNANDAFLGIEFNS